MDSIEAIKQKLAQYFTEQELAVLTDQELHLLVLLDSDELPTVSTEDSARAQAEYRARVNRVLANLPQKPDRSV